MGYSFTLKIVSYPLRCIENTLAITNTVILQDELSLCCLLIQCSDKKGDPRMFQG